MRCNMKNACQYRLYAEWMMHQRVFILGHAHVKTPRPMLRRGVRVGWLPRFYMGFNVAGKDSWPG
jgi:hypothetical protein